MRKVLFLLPVLAFLFLYGWKNRSMLSQWSS